MIRYVELLQAPAEWRALSPAALAGTTCVVFDVLRATTCMAVALERGATAVFPVAEIEDAVAWRTRDPRVLLAGERDGLRITGAAGGVDFDLGNSPRELTRARVAGRTIVTTTTNGTRALRACAGADTVLAAALVNLGAVAQLLRARPPRRLLLVGAGTVDEAAFEDTLAAGALCARLADAFTGAHVGDAARVARDLYAAHAGDVAGALARGVNGARLLAQPALAGDVEYCARVDAAGVVGTMHPDGGVRPA
jgi:2-phosphosulfolactate phosphatase